MLRILRHKFLLLKLIFFTSSEIFLPIDSNSLIGSDFVERAAGDIGLGGAGPFLTQGGLLPMLEGALGAVLFLYDPVLSLSEYLFKLT